MSAYASRPLVFIFTSILFASPAAALADPSPQIVDCSLGDSIQNAVANGNRNQPLALLIRGTCVGNVEISRDDVTLQGDGATITGSITVNGGQRVVIAALTISNPAGNGITITNGSSATIEGNEINDNGAYGLFVRHASFAIVNNNRMLRNGIVVPPIDPDASGMAVAQGSMVRAAGNHMADNLNSGVEVFDNSTYRSEGDTIAMRNAGPIGRSAVDTFRAGHADLRNVSVHGRIFVNQQSQLQVRNAGSGQSTLAGTIDVAQLSYLRLRAGILRDFLLFGSCAALSVCQCDTPTGSAPCPGVVLPGPAPEPVPAPAPVPTIPPV